MPDRSANTRPTSTRTRRTPSAESNATPHREDPDAPALVSASATVPGVPSGRRTIKHGTPPTRRCPSTTRRSRASGCPGAVTTTSTGTEPRNSRSLCPTSSKIGWTAPARAGASKAPKPC